MHRLRSLSILAKSKDIEFNRLDMGRILLLARNCFSKLRKQTLQRQFGQTGALRESPANDTAHQMAQDVFSQLIKDQPRLSELFTKAPYENLNLLFRLLSTFLKNAEALQATDPGEEALFDLDGNGAEGFEHYLQQLAASHQAKRSILAELMHETLDFSVSVLKAQASAETAHLTTHGVAVLIAPLLCSLLNRAGNDFNFIELLSFTEKELQHRLAQPTLAFHSAYHECYANNTRHMAKFVNPDLLQLALAYRHLFSEMVKLRSLLNKQWPSLIELDTQFNNTPLPLKDKKKILNDVRQSYDHAKIELAEKLEHLDDLYNQLIQASILQADQNGGHYSSDISRETAGIAFFKSQSRSHGSLPTGFIPASKLHDNRKCQSFEFLPKPAMPDADAATMPFEITLTPSFSDHAQTVRESTLSPSSTQDLPFKKYQSLLSELKQQLGGLGDEADEPVIPDFSHWESSSPQL